MYELLSVRVRSWGPLLHPSHISLTLQLRKLSLIGFALR